MGSTSVGAVVLHVGANTAKMSQELKKGAAQVRQFKKDVSTDKKFWQSVVPDIRSTRSAARREVSSGGGFWGDYLGTMKGGRGKGGRGGLTPETFSRLGTLTNQGRLGSMLSSASALGKGIGLGPGMAIGNILAVAATYGKLTKNGLEYLRMLRDSGKEIPQWAAKHVAAITTVDRAHAELKDSLNKMGSQMAGTGASFYMELVDGVRALAGMDTVTSQIRAKYDAISTAAEKKRIADERSAKALEKQKQTIEAIKQANQMIAGYSAASSAAALDNLGLMGHRGRFETPEERAARAFLGTDPGKLLGKDQAAQFMADAKAEGERVRTLTTINSGLREMNRLRAALSGDDALTEMVEALRTANVNPQFLKDMQDLTNVQRMQAAREEMEDMRNTLRQSISGPRGALEAELANIARIRNMLSPDEARRAAALATRGYMAAGPQRGPEDFIAQSADYGTAAYVSQANRMRGADKAQEDTARKLNEVKGVLEKWLPGIALGIRDLQDNVVFDLN